jgi:penicillin-binding protein 1B
MAPKKPSRGGARRTGTKPKVARKKRPARKKPTRRGPVTSKRPVPVSWKGRVAKEALTWIAGASLGLAIASGFLWHRAKKDVAAYLANPPRTAPGVVWSAPVTIRKGQQATVESVTSELLAAGYERVDALDGEGQFTWSRGHIDAWTMPMDGPSPLVGGKASLEIEGNRVVAANPTKITFRPAVLGTFGDVEGRRDEVTVDSLSKWMEPALLAMEDTRFRDHHGVDPLGVARALANNLIRGNGTHGGSTLTQQLAKNLFLTSERTMQRKVREAFFAAALEAELSKDELLSLYLGEVYLGQTGGVPIHGVEQAARAWFGVSSERLTLSQAATIAGVISAPNRYTPLRHPDRAQERRDVVLQRMTELSMVTADQAKAAKADSLVTTGVHNNALRQAPWAIDTAADQVELVLGGDVLASGYHVHTTIQPLLQRAAEQAVAQGLAELAMSNPAAEAAQAALVAIRPSDGAVVAMVGGKQYADSAFNRATTAWRQSGSASKPLTLLAAFDADPSLTPLTVLSDEPTTVEMDGTTWSPKNYDGKFLGDVTVRQTIEQSRNLPMLELAETVGREDLKRFMQEAGLTRASSLPSAALGAFDVTPMQMASAYTVFARGGSVVDPHVVASVFDSQGERVYAETSQPVRLASARSTALATDILMGVIDHGTGQRAHRYGVSGPVAGKTGTTNGGRDAWFVGVTPELAVAVWVGADKGSLGVSGSKAALPIWARFVSASGAMTGEFPSPPGLEEVEVCTDSWELARPICENTTKELLASATVDDQVKCSEHGKLNEVTRALKGLFRRKER